MDWVQRIRFGGLIDVPDENGETKTQGTALGVAYDLISKNSSEVDRLNLAKSLVRGSLPKNSDEILFSEDFATKLEVDPGDAVAGLF